MKLSVCIPMYNESAVICDTARTLREYMAAHFEDWELIFADDGSTDGSAELVRALTLPNTRVLSYGPNRGKGCAVRTAMLAAAGDVVLFLDADLAYGPDVIGQAAARMTEDTDVLIGSRALHPEGYACYTPLRALASRIYVRVLNLAGGLRVSDAQCGCKAFRREAAREIFSRMQTDGFAFDFEVLLRAKKLGLRVEEMPVKILRHRGSKVHVLRDACAMLAALPGIKRRVRKSQ